MPALRRIDILNREAALWPDQRGRAKGRTLAANHLQAAGGGAGDQPGAQPGRRERGAIAPGYPQRQEPPFIWLGTAHCMSQDRRVKNFITSGTD